MRLCHDESYGASVRCFCFKILCCGLNILVSISHFPVQTLRLDLVLFSALQTMNQSSSAIPLLPKNGNYISDISTGSYSLGPRYFSWPPWRRGVQSSLIVIGLNESCQGNLLSQFYDRSGWKVLRWARSLKTFPRDSRAFLIGLPSGRNSCPHRSLRDSSVGCFPESDMHLYFQSPPGPNFAKQ